MATLDKRRNTEGKITGYRVRWRLGGTRDGELQSATFSREQPAKTFKGNVEGAGHQWPEDDLAADAASIPAGSISLDELFAAYMIDRARRVRSEATITAYQSSYEKWIKPTFGDRAVNNIDDADIQTWVDSVPRAPKTVANLHALLSAAFTWGARPSRSLVDKTPCGGTELPERRKGAVKGLRAGEWAIFYQAACAESADAADLMLFLVGTGWRWSEATALQVMHLDLDRAEPSVEMEQVWRRGEGGVKLVQDAKSQAGIRRIRLSPMLVDMLKRRTTGKALGDFAFTDHRGQPWSYTTFHKEVMNRPAKGDDPGGIVARAQALGLGKRPTLHWLRHTHVGLMIETGEVSLPAIQRRVGHASITTTIDTYGRMLDDVSSDALVALDSVLFGRKTLRAVK